MTCEGGDHDGDGGIVGVCGGGGRGGGGVGLNAVL